MLFKLSNLNSNLALTLGYLNPALNNSALGFKLRLRGRLFAPDGYLSGSEFPRCGTVYAGSAGSTGQLTTYPSPKSTLTLTSHFTLNVDLGEG